MTASPDESKIDALIEDFKTLDTSSHSNSDALTVRKINTGYLSCLRDHIRHRIYYGKWYLEIDKYELSRFIDQKTSYSHSNLSWLERIDVRVHCLRLNIDAEIVKGGEQSYVRGFFVSDDGRLVLLKPLLKIFFTAEKYEYAPKRTDFTDMVRFFLDPDAVEVLYTGYKKIVCVRTECLLKALERLAFLAREIELVCDFGYSFSSRLVIFHQSGIIETFMKMKAEKTRRREILWARVLLHEEIESLRKD